MRTGLVPAVCAQRVRSWQAVRGRCRGVVERAKAAPGQAVGLPKLPDTGSVCEAEIRTIHVDTDERRGKIALVLTLSGDSI